MYIDPTSGSLALQVLAAAALSAVAMFSRAREAAKSFFRSLVFARPPVDGQPLDSSFRDPSGFVFTRAASCTGRSTGSSGTSSRPSPPPACTTSSPAAAAGAPPAGLARPRRQRPRRRRCSQPEPIPFISYPVRMVVRAAPRRGAAHARDPGARAGPRASRCGTPAPTTSSSTAAGRCSSTRSRSSRGRRVRPGWRTASSASTSWCRSRS